MLGLQSEDLIPLRAAARELPSGRPGKSVHAATVFRWIAKGTRGVRLEACRVGGTWYTSREALRRFSAALTARSLSGVPDRSEAETSRAAALAGAELAGRGA